MTNKELADLIFPNINEDTSIYEAKYPERNLPENAVVSRFAPSPTGFVHMGSLLSAFIESFVPKITGGIFYLRVEDTDGKRTVENGINGIIKDLGMRLQSSRNKRERWSLCQCDCGSEPIEVKNNMLQNG